MSVVKASLPVAQKQTTSAATLEVMIAKPTLTEAGLLPTIVVSINIGQLSPSAKPLTCS
jgi:hypothetical protein